MLKVGEGALIVFIGIVLFLILMQPNESENPAELLESRGIPYDRIDCMETTTIRQHCHVYNDGRLSILNLR